MSVDMPSKILGPLPREKAFYFFTSIGNYTGASASSLKEFVERISEVNVKSLEFHLGRGDFEKWTDEVLQDSELAEEFKRLDKLSLAGEALRYQLSSIASKRFRQLTSQTNQFQSRYRSSSQ